MARLSYPFLILALVVPLVFSGAAQAQSTITISEIRRQRDRQTGAACQAACG
jgi:hypothetical protein